MKYSKIVIFLLATVFLYSCQSYSDGRMLKKFISRFNAEEYACAASYVYPGDRMNVAFFATEVKALAPYVIISLEDYSTVNINEDERKVHATLKWDNVTPTLTAYFNDIGHPIDNKGRQSVDMIIRKTKDGETLSFVWGIPNVLSDHLRIASVVTKDDKPVEKTNIYTSPDFKAPIKGVMEKDLIVGPEDENGWMPTYQTNKQTGHVETYYINQNKGLEFDRSAFFTLSIFDSMSLIVALLIVIVIIVPLYYVSSILSSIFNGLPLVGPIICIALILGLVYIIYQLLEKILFELFIINLPY